MDFEFIREQTPLYIEAAKLTLHMAVIGVLLAIVVGLVCSMIKYFRIPVLRQIVECYIELSRNTPLLIQLFFLYFGLPKIGIVLSSEQCAITGLTFRRQLYGRSLPKRPGQCSTHSGGIRIKPWNE